MHPFSILFLIAILVHAAVHLWLGARHARHVLGHRDRVPAEFADSIALAQHQRAADYTLARLRLGRIDLLVGHALLIGWTLGGGLDALDRALAALLGASLWQGVAFLLLALLLMGLLELPLAAWRTFVLEQRFGFNRTTPRTFAFDLLKRTALLLVLGAPLAALVLWLMSHAGAAWWLWVWGVWMAFSLLMMWAFPRFIAPLFNTFEALEDGELRRRIESLLARSGFSAEGVFVMDGSTRSSHGNAYFTGFGRHKRIVFFDTLVDELAPEEIESVLAHELGHFKLRHVFKQFALMSALSLAGLALLGWLGAQPWFYTALGVSTASAHAALMLFLLVAPVFTFLLQPLLARLSRRYEFEADRYAAEQADPRSLIRALVKLYRDNASTLTPDPLYSAFHDSHPPAPLRVARLAALAR